MQDRASFRGMREFAYDRQRDGRRKTKGSRYVLRNTRRLMLCHCCSISGGLDTTRLRVSSVDNIFVRNCLPHVRSAGSQDCPKSSR
jgi:hypothetical protein